MKPEPQSPVSFAVHVARLPKKGMPVQINADEEQRRRLAEEHDLLSVERFVADLLVNRWMGDGVMVNGTVSADITQECVVTLDPLPARIEEKIDALFVPEGSRLARQGAHREEIVLDPEGSDIPDVFSGDTIDIGALAEEFFTLAIDPYPRSPRADMVAEPAEPDSDETESPFAKLRQLKKNR